MTPRRSGFWLAQFETHLVKEKLTAVSWPRIHKTHWGSREDQVWFFIRMTEVKENIKIIRC